MGEKARVRFSASEGAEGMRWHYAILALAFFRLLLLLPGIGPKLMSTIRSGRQQGNQVRTGSVDSLT